MFIFRNGCTVHIGDSHDCIKAVVLGVSMSGNDYSKINYLCSWWDGKTHKEEWLDCNLVEPCEETGNSIEVSLYSTAKRNA